MAQQTFSNGETRGDIRNKLNANASDAESRLTTAESKLSGIESGAKDDQTGGEIKALYEAEANTNAFTDAEKTKLGNQSGTNTGDQDLSSLQPKPAEGAFADGDKTKLDAIETGATADQTAAEIKTAYESNSNTNAFTDAYKSTLDGIDASAYGIICTQVGVTGETTVDTTPRKVTAWNTNGISSGTTVDHTDDSIAVSNAGTYKVDCSISFNGTNSKTYRLELYVFDVSAGTWSASGYALERKLGTSGDVGSASVHGIISLDTGDKVALYQSSSDGGTALTVTEAQLSVDKL